MEGHAHTEGHTHSVETHPEGARVQLTEKAAEKIRAFGSGNKEATGKHFRVYVQGGGCSGFQYGFTFDEKREDDSVIQAGASMRPSRPGAWI